MELTPTRTDRTLRDDGIVLVLTLVLTVVAGTIALALASFAATGLRTSAVTDERIAHRAAAAAAVEYVADALANTDAARADDPCAEVATIDAGYWPGGVVADVTCGVTSTGDPVVLTVTATSGPSSIAAVVEVRSEAVDRDTGRHPVAVTSWSLSDG